MGRDCSPHSAQPPIDDANDISELPHTSPKRESSYYAALAVIALVWSVVPLSWGYVLRSLWYGTLRTNWSSLCLFVMALSEVIFSIWHFYLSHTVSGPSVVPPGDVSELQIMFKRVLQAGTGVDDVDEETLDVSRPGTPEDRVLRLQKDDVRAVEFRNVLRTWFRYLPWSQVRQQEVYAWMYWSIFNVAMPPIDTLSYAHRVLLDEVFEMINLRAGCRIPEGSSGVAPYLLSVDPLNVRSRPLVWYAFVAVSNWLLRRRFESRWNAPRLHYKGLDYIIRIPPNWDPLSGPRPIVLLHGLGLGLVQYQLFISHLLHQLPDYPLLIPLQPHISQDIFHPRFLTPMGRYEMATCLAELLHSLGWAEREEPADSPVSLSDVPKRRQGVTVLSHSNGSFVHAWLLKTHPHLIARSCFVDPVTFCTWQGDVCYNFIYRQPSNGFEMVMKYFVATELGVANTIQRNFDWTANSLWCEEIPHVRDPSKAVFFLGGKDAILNADRVKQYLTSHGIGKGLWFDPDGQHGEALLAGGKGHAEILRWLQEEHT